MGNTASGGQNGGDVMVNMSKVKHLCNPLAVACRYHLEKDRSLHDDYKVSSEILGQGLCGNVVVAYSRADERRYAVKILSKEGVHDIQKLQQLVAEVEIHLAMDHPNIAYVKDVYESETAISMVTECCEGGELYAALQEKGVFGNAEAAEVARQMVSVVRHLHGRSVVHRDLKLENFLYRTKNPHVQMEKYLQQKENAGHMLEAPQLKLIDFGFARVWDKSRLMRTACGSAEYVSPDVLCGEGYTAQTDLWSIGVIVWMLLTGYPPFHGSKQDMMTNIRKGKPDWSHQSRWKNVSQDAKDFVQKLLVKDPRQRLDASAALQHPWLTPRHPISTSPLSYNRAVLSLQRYAASSKLRRAALQILVQQLDWEDTQKLRKLFFSIDQESQGWISPPDLRAVMQQVEQTSNESQCQLEYSKQPDELFAALDANGDQRIYFSEFAAAAARICRRDHRHALKAAFARLDVDGSGSIGIQDLQAALGKTFEDAEAQDLLTEVRAEGSELNYEAFVEALDVSADDSDAISPNKGRGFFWNFSTVAMI